MRVGEVVVQFGLLPLQLLVAEAYPQVGALVLMALMVGAL